MNERGVAYEAQVVTNGYLLTPEMADLLARSKVTFAQITVDGIGVTHDLTRRPVGGGGTFERIIENILRPGLRLGVRVRHNVHEGNFHEVGQVEELMRRIAEESGNRVMYYAEPVLESDVAEAHGEQVRLLDRDRAAAIRLRQGAPRVPVGIDHTCTAQNMWALLVDEMGNLHKCAGMTASDPESAFGHAHDWDPRDPIGTASRPDNITRWLNTAMPVADEECAECVWLPLCGGGCPHYRLQGRRMCPPFKDDPEAYVLSSYEYLQKRRKQTPSWIGRPIAG